MTLPTDTVWEVQTGGADTNGGGFADSQKGATGTDLSLVTAAALTLTDGATSGVGVTTLTSATGGFLNTMLGNLIYIASGTNATAGYYCITGFTDTNTVTLDRAPDDGVGAMSAANLKVGGCLASPGQLGVALNDGVHGVSAWVKSGTYTMTTSSAASNGKFYVSALIGFVVEGYETTRGDRGAKPVLANGAYASITLWGASTTIPCSPMWINLKADGNSQASVNGFAGGYYSGISACAHLCDAVDCAIGLGCGTDGCYAEGCTTGMSAASWRGFAKSCTYSFGVLAFDCVGTGGTYFSASAAQRGIYKNCVAHNMSGDGFKSLRNFTLVNCLAVDCGGYGFSGNSANVTRLFNCYGYNNTSGDQDANVIGDVVALSADPFADSAAFDFELNETAGGGAVIRGVGVPIPDQTANHDVGAVQHADPAGGGGAPGNMSGGLQ